MSMNVHQMQAEAVREGMEAKRDFEIEAQRAKVRALVEQTRDRLDSLSRRADDVYRAVVDATDRPLPYPAGAFGHDTDTLDGLLVTLSEESAALDHLLAAKEKTEDLQGKYHTLISEAIEAEQKAQGEGQPEGQVFEMPGVGGGAYL